MVQQVSQGGIIDLIALLRARARQGLQGRGAVLAAEHRKLERVEPIQQPLRSARLRRSSGPSTAWSARSASTEPTPATPATEAAAGEAARVPPDTEKPPSACLGREEDCDEIGPAPVTFMQPRSPCPVTETLTAGQILPPGGYGRPLTNCAAENTQHFPPKAGTQFAA